MIDPLASLGVYLSKCGRETPSPRLPDRHTAGRYQLAFVRGPVYGVVDNLGGSPAAAPALVDFALRLTKRLPRGEPPAPFGALPEEGRVPGSERILRGALALGSIVTLAEGNPLRLSTDVTAVAARYTAGTSTPRHRIVVPYPDADLASAALRAVVADLDPQLTRIAATDDRLVFRDRSGAFGLVGRIERRIEIDLGLDRAP